MRRNTIARILAAAYCFAVLAGFAAEGDVDQAAVLRTMQKARENGLSCNATNNKTYQWIPTFSSLSFSNNPDTLWISISKGPVADGAPHTLKLKSLADEFRALDFPELKALPSVSLDLSGLDTKKPRSGYQSIIEQLSITSLNLLSCKSPGDYVEMAGKSGSLRTLILSDIVLDRCAIEKIVRVNTIRNIILDNCSVTDENLRRLFKGTVLDHLSIKSFPEIGQENLRRTTPENILKYISCETLSAARLERGRLDLEGIALEEGGLQAIQKLGLSDVSLDQVLEGDRRVDDLALLRCGPWLTVDNLLVANSDLRGTFAPAFPNVRSVVVDEIRSDDFDSSELAKLKRLEYVWLRAESKWREVGEFQGFESLRLLKLDGCANPASFFRGVRFPKRLLGIDLSLDENTEPVDLTIFDRLRKVELDCDRLGRPLHEIVRVGDSVHQLSIRDYSGNSARNLSELVRRSPRIQYLWLIGFHGDQKLCDELTALREGLHVEHKFDWLLSCP